MVFNWISAVKCMEEINHLEVKLSSFECGIKIFSTLLFSIISIPSYSIFENSFLKTGFQHVKLRVRIFQFVACIRSLHSTSEINLASLVLQLTRQAALKNSISFLIREDWKLSPLMGVLLIFLFTVLSCSIFVLFLHICRTANYVFYCNFCDKRHRGFK
jgi:hypothetical protein